MITSSRCHFSNLRCPRSNPWIRTGVSSTWAAFPNPSFPACALATWLAPKAFIREVRALRASVLRHPPGHIQRTAAYFLSLGHYDSLIRKTGQVYAKRRSVMEEALADNGLKITGRGLFGGSSIWMRAPEGTDMNMVDTELRKKGVLLEPGVHFFHGDNPPRNFYRLAYSSIPAKLIPEGIAILARELDQS